MTTRGSHAGVNGRGRRARFVAFGIAASLLIAACTSDSGSTPTSGSTTTTTIGTTTTDGSVTPTTVDEDPNNTGAQLIHGVKLSEGQASSIAKPVPLVDGTPLDDAAITAVEDRLPAWVLQDALVKPFNWPTQSLPVPIAGSTVPVDFPVADDTPAPEVPTGPLHVLRKQPEGAVDIAPFVSITFDQPMVPVTTVGQLAAADVPATITPDLAGKWQWIGTSTLRFDATSDVIDRLPMATDYTVEIPAGTTSATGGVLADAVTFQFSTPPVTVQSFGPYGDDTPLPLSPIFLATFDQRVDAQAVLDSIVVTAGDQPAPMRLATADEIAADETLGGATGALPEGRWIAFTPVTPFAPATGIHIEIGPGTPSAEGPVTTTAAASYDARTYEPLSLISAECSYEPDCPPPSDIVLTFNNQLDTEAFDPASIGVDPPIAGMVVSAYGSSISIHGATQGRTSYTVTVPAGLTDVFGQQLAEAATRTVEIGEAAPILQQFSRPFTTLDPLVAKPNLPVVTVNHDDFRLRAYRVSPEDWAAYSTFFESVIGNTDEQLPGPPGELVDDRVVAVDAKPDQFVETTVDLSSYLGGKPGHLVVLVEPTEHYNINDSDYWNNRPTVTWAQSTSIGLDAFTDATTLHAWTTNLGDGAPLPGVDVSLQGDSQSVTTDADGLATVELGSGSALVATNGDDTALLPNGYYSGSAWQRQPLDDQALWYVFDDRQVYKPGETVSIKGWVRRLTSSSDSQLALIAPGVKLDYTATDAQGNSIATGQVDVNPLGGFDFTFDIPAAANLGYSYVQLGLSNVDALPFAAYTHNFQIQEFRRPEFEVGARTESEGPYVQGSPLTLAADANYYAGGPLGAAPVDWAVTTSSAAYSPPGWDEFTFGRWTPWWYSDFGYPGSDSRASIGGFSTPPSDPCCFASTDSNTATFHGETDADGSHYLQVDVGSIDDPDLAGLPVAVSAQATVTDINRQALAATTSALVHPSDFYVGLRGDRTFVEKGDALDIDAVVTDIDGAVAAGRSVQVVATRSESSFEHGEYVTKQVDPQTCDVTSAADPVTCTFSTTIGGEYTISASVTDDKGRASRTELTRWVSGEVAPPTRSVEQQQLTIVPDQQEYAPGTSAQLLVQSPFATGHGLVTVTRGQIVSTSRFEVADGSAIVDVPIADSDIPGVSVSIEVVGATDRTADDGSPLPGAPQRPAYATGGLSLTVSTASRTLDVTATPQADAVEPGTTTAVDVTVNDSDGKPVEGSELAVVVVDEAVLALSGYQLGDPLATFYAQLPSYLSTQYGRDSIILSNPADLAVPGQEGAPATTTLVPGDTTVAATETTAGAGAADGGFSDKSAEVVPASAPSINGGDRDAAGNPIAVRTNFDALAVFEPSVTTDADGHATVEVPLPDNLTRYRVMVVAVADADHFGSAESNITARLPLMVRPSAPRFLNFGDTFELPVVVQNQTDAGMTVDVVLQTDNLTATNGNADGAVGKQVTVPANDRVEVRFPVSAAQAGTARFRVAGVSGDAADAATVELPVYTPATAEAFATYGVLDDGATVQPMLPPTGVFPQFGGLDITTSSTSLQALTDAVLYLSQYPYETSDAMASRIIAISSLRDVLDAFDAPGLPSADALNAVVSDDIDRLVALQNDDGGFPYWEHGRESDPYNSIQATHALVVAKADGFAIPDFALQAATGFLTNIEQYILDQYNSQASDSLSAYALNVRMLAGDRDAAKAKALFDSRGEDLPLDAIAWLWPVIDDADTSAAIERIIQNKAVDTAGAVTFTSEATDDDYVTLRSDRRTDGLILDDLIALTPDSDLIPKVVTGLLAAQSQGHWDNVQENSFILLAMKHYFDTYESQTPEFVAKVWLGDRFAGDHSFSGRSTDRALLEIPTGDLIATGQADPAGSTNITISKEGTGRLYYRIGLRTAPDDLVLEPLDRGFVVARTYEAVDDPGDVTRDADGTWHIKAGARVRVRLTMVAESQRTHVALIDPLPAGLEILNPELATTPDVPTDPNQGSGGGCEFGGDCIYSDVASFVPWRLTWFDHQNLRDDRAEAFSNYLSAGTYDYTYVARATTPGSFVVPPVRAEEMYFPETFGRGASDTVVVAG